MGGRVSSPKEGAAGQPVKEAAQLAECSQVQLGHRSEPPEDAAVAPKLVRRSQRLTFAQRCRQAAQIRAPCNLQQAPATSGSAQRRQKRKYEEPPKSFSLDDDDSVEEDCSALKCMLATGSLAALARLRYSTRGHKVYIEGLRGCKGQALQLSATLARVFAHDTDPSSCVGLQNGRLTAFGRSSDFQLKKVQNGWLLVADSRLFFNFVLRRWQPLNLAIGGPYAAVSELLYVAFVPEHSPGPIAGGKALFVKLGYRELADGEGLDQHALIGYVEKKSRRLRLTNVRGAGLFVFSAPPGHDVFARPCRAAEASLKTELLHSDLVKVMPSGHLGDLGTFSASLEYFFVEAAGSHCSDPLAALTQFLRDFTNSPGLMPQLAQASDGGGLRRGRKRLKSWPDAIQGLPAWKRARQQVEAAGRSGEPTLLDAPSKSAQASVQQVACLRSRAKRAQLVAMSNTQAPAMPRGAFVRHSA